VKNLNQVILQAVTAMYKVTNTLTSAYGPPDMMDFKPKHAPEMPRASVGNRKLTNIGVGGDSIMGIRRVPEDDTYADPTLAGDAMEKPITRPLRYTPGLKCDAHLESLRPERASNHRAIQGGEDWKRKLVQAPNHFEGSFVDADMQKFRPEPNVNPAEDPWFASRLPDQTMQSYDRLSGPATTYGYPELPLSGPYGQMYPQDELSRIKMRNRRFMNACAMEMGMGQGMGMGMGMGGPMMMMPPPTQMMMPGLDADLATDELGIIDQELNMTRRANRPFVPSHHQDYFNLQRQVQDMEQPMEVPRRAPPQEVVSVEQLPLPKRTVRTATSEAGSAAAPASNRPEVNIADQIAIRSLVLSKSIGKVSGNSQ